MCILSLFNYFEKLTVAEIQEHMGFDQETCKKNLQSLMWAKGKILLVKDNVFSVNKAFKSQLRRITYPVPVLEEVVKKEKI